VKRTGQRGTEDGHKGWMGGWVDGWMDGSGGTSDQFGYILRYVLKGVEFRFVEAKKSWKKVRMDGYNRWTVGMVMRGPRRGQRSSAQNRTKGRVVG